MHNTHQSQTSNNTNKPGCSNPDLPKTKKLCAVSYQAGLEAAVALLKRHAEAELEEFAKPLLEAADAVESLTVTTDAAKPGMQVNDQCTVGPEPVKLQFPTMLRKMWTGSEVQQWLDEQAPLYAAPVCPEKQEPKAPNWYTRVEIMDCLKRMNYCDSVAEELADWFLLHLKHSFNKGFQVGQWKMYAPVQPVAHLDALSLLKKLGPPPWATSPEAHAQARLIADFEDNLAIAPEVVNATGKGE